MPTLSSPLNTARCEQFFLSGKCWKLILLAVLSAVAQISAYGQAYTESVLYSPPSLSAGIGLYSPVIQASDGNFYGVALNTKDASGNLTGGSTLYKVSPLGQSSVLLTLPTSVAFVQRSLVQGADGALYGVDEGGSSNGSIFRVDLSGNYSVVHAFCTNPTNGICTDGRNPNAALVEGSDGNFYGTTSAGGTNDQAGTVFRVSSSGTFTNLYNFCSAGMSACPDGTGPWGLVQGSDGNFYGATYSGGAYCPSQTSSAVGCGTIFKISSSGTLTTLHTFAGGSDAASPFSTLVEASDGSFYGVTQRAPNFIYIHNGPLTSPAIFRRAPDGTVSSPYTLQTSQTNFQSENGPVIGSDGNVYGTDTEAGANGTGNIYQLTPSGLATTIYSLPSYSYPVSPLIQGSDGNFVGTTVYGGNQLTVSYGSGSYPAGTVYKLSVAPALTPPVSLSLSQQTIQSGQPVTLNWSVANAYSLSLQQCYAFVQGTPSGAGTWTGLQTGTFNASSTPPFKGSATITPTANGVYVYALTCGGKESGFATLIVGTPPTLSVTTASLPAGQVGNAYSQTFTATGGVPPYTWSISNGSLPAGVVLSSATGAIAGTPTTPGTASFTVQVKDSETTPQIANANLSILVNPAPLAITTTTLGGGTVGTAYSQTLQASGGITPYTWNIASGALPPGLSLSSSTGVISGTPTSAATFVFSVKATDAEGTPQTASAGFNIAVANTTLFVGTGTLAAGSVGTPYSASLQAYGGVAPYTWSVTSGSLPAGLTLGTSTGTISGTPTSAGAASFTVQVRDAEGTPETASANLTLTVNTTTPSITFNVPNHTYGDAPFTVSATSNSSGAISYSVVSGPATISGSTVTLTGVGTVVLQASQVAAGNYAAGTQTATFTVAGSSPSISFSVPNHTYGDAPFTVAASSNSSGTITYSVVSGPATISGSTVTLTGVGTVVLLASQVAAGNYGAGTQTATFTVAGNSPTISFSVPNHTYGDAPFTVSATSNSSGAITYSVVSGPATISGSTVTLTGAGTVVLQASQVASGNYAAGTQTASITIAKESQTITFPALVTPIQYSVAPISLSASASSGLTTAFSVLSGPGTISGSTLTISGVGTVVVAANQAGNTNFAAASQVTQSIVVNTASQTITFTAPASPTTYSASPITLVATGGASGNVVVFSVVSGPATVSGSTLTLTGVGTVVVAANQAGNANYAAATQVTQSIVVNVIGAAATPTFSPVAGTYSGTQTVSISDATPGATIYYTTNGTTPTTGSSLYSGAISVSSTETLRAIATATGYSTSAVATAAYTILTNPVPAIGSTSPAFTNAGGTLFTLTVNGSGFVAGSTVYWGASALTTTYVSATQLTAQVPATDITSIGTFAITVQTPAPGGGTSNTWQFEVDTSGSTAPTISSTTATVAAGSTASYPVTVPSGVNSFSVTCLNLPTGASCSYSSTTNTITIATSSTTPKGTYQITVVFTETVAGAGFLLPILLLPLAFRKKSAGRGIWLTACLGLVMIATAAFISGCGSSGGSGSSTVPATHQVTSSGTVSLTIQ